MARDITIGKEDVVVSLKIEAGRLSLGQEMLPAVWRDDPLEAVVRIYGILIKPCSLTQKVRGVVGNRLSYSQLEELYSQRG